MSYKNLLERLKNLPENERLLASGVYFFEEDGKEVCGCVLGKGLPPSLHDRLFAQNAENIWDLILTDNDLEGMTWDEASAAQDENDTFRYPQLSEKEIEREGSLEKKNSLNSRIARYDHMIKWLERQEAGRELQEATDEAML